MKLKSVILTGVVLFVVYFGLEFGIHGGLLSGIYKETASVWRPEAEMKGMMGYMTLGQLIFAFFFGLIFAKGYENGKAGLGQGLRFGILMALLLAPMNALVWYVILPIPQILAVYWFLAGAVEMVALGLVAGLVYRP